MIIKVTYRKGTKAITVESKEKGVRAVAKDCAAQLSKNYQSWRKKQGNPISRMALKRYEIGQEYMLIEKIQERMK